MVRVVVYRNLDDYKTGRYDTINVSRNLTYDQVKQRVWDKFGANWKHFNIC